MRLVAGRARMSIITSRPLFRGITMSRSMRSGSSSSAIETAFSGSLHRRTENPSSTSIASSIFSMSLSSSMTRILEPVFSDKKRPPPDLGLIITTRLSGCGTRRSEPHSPAGLGETLVDVCRDLLLGPLPRHLRAAVAGRHRTGLRPGHRSHLVGEPARGVIGEAGGDEGFRPGKEVVEESGELGQQLGVRDFVLIFDDYATKSKVVKK